MTYTKDSHRQRTRRDFSGHHDLKLGMEGVYTKELGRCLDKIEWER